MINSKERLMRNEVMAIPAPEFTNTWHPVSHKEVIESLDYLLKAKGVGVVQEIYSTKSNGQNLFGTWVLDIERNGKHIQLGFRNSIKKTFAVGICAGTFVVVCSNMQFKGEFIEFRKHTSGLNYEELLQLGDRAFEQVIDQGNKAIEWHERLHSINLDTTGLKCITYDAMEKGILAPTRFNQFQQAYQEEIELTKNEGSLYEFHAAITRMNRDLNLFTVDNRTRALADLCDTYINQRFYENC